MVNFVAEKRKREEIARRNAYRKEHPQQAYTQTAPDWRKYRDDVRAGMEAYQRAESIGTRLEKANAGEDYVNKRESLRAIIEDGVISEHAAAVAHLEDCGRQVEKERAAITNGWDSARLANELALYSARITAATQAGNLQELQNLRDEATGSQDRYKIRAYAVAIQSSASRLPEGTQDPHGTDGRMVVNRMQHEAARELEALKTSPGLEKAVQSVHEALAITKAAQSEIIQTSADFGELAPNGSIIHNSNFVRELGRIKIYPDGSFETFVEV